MHTCIVSTPYAVFRTCQLAQPYATILEVSGLWKHTSLRHKSDRAQLRHIHQGTYDWVQQSADYYGMIIIVSGAICKISKCLEVTDAMAAFASAIMAAAAVAAGGPEPFISAVTRSKATGGVMPLRSCPRRSYSARKHWTSSSWRCWI